MHRLDKKKALENFCFEFRVFRLRHRHDNLQTYQIRVQPSCAQTKQVVHIRLSLNRANDAFAIVFIEYNQNDIGCRVFVFDFPTAEQIQ